MFVLDSQYTSNELLDFLESSHEPVLNNDAAKMWARKCTLNLAADLKPGERIITASEMHLDQVKEICAPETSRAIDLCKDKAAMRAALKPLYPDYTFFSCTARELQELDPKTIAFPVVVKPVTGFFSLGIYPVFNESEWHEAVADIAEHSHEWQSGYNENVVNDNAFLVESYIEGDEYALDAYYDDAGAPVMLNIFAHEFADREDTSDRLYYCSKRVMDAQFDRMEAFLREVNALLGFRGFPIHVEVRVTSSGRVIPIEFNPLRFAGLCNTDLSWFAWGHKTYECFLRDTRPDWPRVLAAKDGIAYAMIILQKDGFDPTRPYTFDYDAACKTLSHVLDLRVLDYATQGAFCFIFAEVPENRWEEELAPLLRSTLDEFIAYPPERESDPRRR